MSSHLFIESLEEDAMIRKADFMTFKMVKSYGAQGMEFGCIYISLTSKLTLMA